VGWLCELASGCLCMFDCRTFDKGIGVTGAHYREVNSKVATAPKLKVEGKDRVNNSQRIKRLNLISLR